MPTTKTITLFLLTSIISLPALSQAFSNIQNKKVGETITNLYDYLDSHKTDTSLGAIKRSHTSDLYKSVVRRFYNKPEMLKQLGLGEVDTIIQYQTLHGIDKTIDVIPLDSIFVMECSQFNEKVGGLGVRPGSSRYFAGFTINGKPYPMLDIRFDSFGKIIFALPVLNFDHEQGAEVQRFMERQSNVKTKSTR